MSGKLYFWALVSLAGMSTFLSAVALSVALFLFDWGFATWQCVVGGAASHVVFWAVVVPYAVTDTEELEEAIK